MPISNSEIAQIFNRVADILEKITTPRGLRKGLARVSKKEGGRNPGPAGRLRMP